MNKYEIVVYSYLVCCAGKRKNVGLVLLQYQGYLEYQEAQ